MRLAKLSDSLAVESWAREDMIKLAKLRRAAKKFESGTAHLYFNPSSGRAALTIPDSCPEETAKRWKQVVGKIVGQDNLTIGSRTGDSAWIRLTNGTD